MNSKLMISIGRWLCVAVIVLAIAACAGTQAYKEGNALLESGKIEPGLAKLEEAIKLDPTNAEYKIALANQKSTVINELHASAGKARRLGKFDDAEKAYNQILAIDPNNVFAMQGLKALVVDRRHSKIIDDAEDVLKKALDGKGNDGFDKTSAGLAQGLSSRDSINLKLNSALEKLRAVLIENPDQKAALNLKARINERQAQKKTDEEQLAVAFRKPITLEFRDAPLRTVFDLISKVSGLNIFFDKDVRADLKTTLITKQTSIEDVIHLLLVTNQLEQTVLSDNAILIYPNSPQKHKDYQPLSVRTFYLANADVKAVSNTLKTILKTKDMVVDERLGLIIMRDTPETIRMADRIIALQDLSDPEVMLEVEVMEIKRSRLMELGIRWPESVGLSLAQMTSTDTSGTTPVTTSVPLTLGSLGGVNKNNINVAIGNTTINAKKENSDSNILANPRIRVRNKEKAKILIGDRVPVITATSTSTGFVSDSVSYIDVGLKLEVEPNIYLDEEVAIKVNLEVSNLVREVISKSGTLSYQIGTRNASTVLRLKDGETQVLAGLISNEDRSTANRVPGLGELPILSRLFGSQKDDNQRSEIVLSITPRIIRSIRRPDLIAAEFSAGTESNIGARALTLGKVNSDISKTAIGGMPNRIQTNRQVPANTANRPSVSMEKSALPPSSANTSGTGAQSPSGTIGAISFNWQGANQVNVGEQFSAVLNINSQSAVRILPLLLGFDTSVLQVVGVQEGDFMNQAGGQSSFSSRIDVAQGKIYVNAVRQNSLDVNGGSIGTGNVVKVNFKAIKTGATKIQLLTATTEPAAATPIALPVDFSIKVQ